MPSPLNRLEIILFARDLASKAVEVVSNKVRGIKPATEEAEKGSKRLEQSFEQTEKQSNSLAASIQRTKAVLIGFAASLFSLNLFRKGILSVLETGSRFETLELQIKQLYDTAEEGDTAFAWVRQFAKENPAFDIAQAFLKLKAFGIEPTTGSLQALVDQTAKLGGNQETLEGIILAVGQAWAKQKLQGEEILQLVERGVPVWDLLSKAVGLNVQELQKLSEQGKLGRREIALLLNEIGQSSEGAAKAQLGTFSGLVATLQNQWIRFLDTIARSGVLDVFKQQLEDLNQKIERLAANGKLRQFAQQISDAISGAVKIIRALIDAIASLGGSIAVLLKIAIVVKAVTLAFGGLFRAVTLLLQVGFAVKLIGWTKALRDYASSAITSSQATEQVGVSVESSSKRAGRFSGLISGLSGLLKGGLVAAAIAGTIEIIKLGGALLDAAKAAIRLSDTTEEINANNALLAEKAREAREQLAGYRNEAILTQSQLNELSEEEIEAYQKRLNAAQEYFLAVRVEARALGDDAGFDAATEKVNAYEQGLQNAANRLQQLRKEAAAAAAVQAKSLAALEENLSALGLSLRQVETGISDAEQEIIDAVDNIAQSTRLTGDIIATAFTEAFQKVESPAALKRLREILDRVSSDAIKVKGETEGLKQAEQAYINVLTKRGKELKEIQNVQTKTNQSAIKQIGDITAAFDGSVESVEAVTAAIQDSNDSLKQQREAAAGVGKAIDETTEAQKEQAKAQQEQAVVASELAAASDFYNDILRAQEKILEGVGQKAVETFQNSLGGSIKIATDEVSTFNDRLTEANQRLLEGLRAEQFSEGVFSQIAGFFQRVSAEIEVATLRQLASAENLVNGLASNADQARIQLASLDTSVEGLGRRFNLLDETQLNNLSSELEDVRNQVRALDEEAQRTLQGLEERLLRLQGNEIELIDLRNQRERLELEEKLAKARDANDQKAIAALEESLRLLKEINQEELKRARDKERDRDNRRSRDAEDDDTRSSGGGGTSPNNNPPSFNPPINNQPPSLLPQQPQQPINLNFSLNGKDLLNPEAIRRNIIPEIEKS